MTIGQAWQCQSFPSSSLYLPSGMATWTCSPFCATIRLLPVFIFACQHVKNMLTSHLLVIFTVTAKKRAYISCYSVINLFHFSIDVVFIFNSIELVIVARLKFYHIHHACLPISLLATIMYIARYCVYVNRKAFICKSINIDISCCNPYISM